MKKALIFSKRNFLEMLRDPVIYVFCIGFPFALIILFVIIDKYTHGAMPVFSPRSLVPGVIVFSYAFVMMAATLLVSKDRASAFLVRLYSSPMKTSDFVVGYFIPLFAVGLVQLALCLVTGAIVAAITGGAYFGFGRAMLVALSSLPALITFIGLGVLFGTALNDKSAPGLTSVVISAAGILGGCWMPLDTMGGFEMFCRCLPFYPSVWLGRVAAGSTHTFGGAYTLEGCWWVFVAIFAYLAAAVAAALFVFSKKSKAK